MADHSNLKVCAGNNIDPSIDVWVIKGSWSLNKLKFYIFSFQFFNFVKIIISTHKIKLHDIYSIF